MAVAIYHVGGVHIVLLCISSEDAREDHESQEATYTTRRRVRQAAQHLDRDRPHHEDGKSLFGCRKASDQVREAWSGERCHI